MPHLYLGGDIVQRAAIVSHMRSPSRLERTRRSLCKLTAAESPKERFNSRTSDSNRRNNSPSTKYLPRRPGVSPLKCFPSSTSLTGLKRSSQHQRIRAAYLVEKRALRHIYTPRPHKVLAIACCNYLDQVPELTAEI